MLRTPKQTDSRRNQANYVDRAVPALLLVDLSTDDFQM